MPHRQRPRRGSLQFYPRKRAARIYSKVSIFHGTEEKPLAFAGWKAGMTHVKFTEPNSKSPSHGKAVAKAVTIIDTPPLLVCGARFYAGRRAIGEKWMDNLPKDIQGKTGRQLGKVVEGAEDVRLIVATQSQNSSMKRGTEVFEIGVGGKNKTAVATSLIGKQISAKDVFANGEKIIVSSVTKGHGFTGPVKRFGIRIQTRKDKQMNRHVGSIGPTTPRKVDWRVPAPGQHGLHTRTDFNKKILLIEEDPTKINVKGGYLRYGNVKSTYLLIEGSVPGTPKRFLILKKASRASKKELPVDLQYISLESKQGV